MTDVGLPEELSEARENDVKLKWGINGEREW